MKLAILGAAVLILGAVLGIAGLMAVGGLWIATGLVVRSRVQQLQRDEAERAPATTPGAKRPVDARTVTINTITFVAIGLPALVIGIFGLGFDEADAGWRWLPIGVGALALGVAVVGALLYALGAGLTAAAESAGVPDRPAVITIRAVRETGTFINERPRLEFDLLVQPDGLPAYQVTKRATVPFTALGSVGVGDGFRAQVVGPEKPTAMEIDWDAPMHGSGQDTSVRLSQLDRLRDEGKVTAEEYQAQRRRILDSI